MPLPSTDAGSVFREAVATLSARLTADFGELVPEASADRTAALLDALEAGGRTRTERGIRLSDEHVATLDAWIRLADNATLHDDTREASTRTRIAEALRAIRVLAAPRFPQLVDDRRETELGA